MLKNIIFPVQAWLLSQGRCVGCGMPLSQGTKGKNPRTVICKCKRVYVFNKAKNSYRRALLTEI